MTSLRLTRRQLPGASVAAGAALLAGWAGSAEAADTTGYYVWPNMGS